MTLVPPSSLFLANFSFPLYIFIDFHFCLHLQSLPLSSLSLSLSLSLSFSQQWCSRFLVSRPSQSMAKSLVPLVSARRFKISLSFYSIQFNSIQFFHCCALMFVAFLFDLLRFTESISLSKLNHANPISITI